MITASLTDKVVVANNPQMQQHLQAQRTQHMLAQQQQARQALMAQQGFAGPMNIGGMQITPQQYQAMQAMRQRQGQPGHPHAQVSRLDVARWEHSHTESQIPSSEAHWLTRRVLYRQSHNSYNYSSNSRLLPTRWLMVSIKPNRVS
jgi:membrane carboxypeptidase/penicillin-binding protein PbpC